MRIQEKRWNKEFEQPIYEEWKKSKAYAFKEDPSKKLFSIDTPPPYVNTPIHIGQATTYVLMDMFARYRRMKGYNVLFPLGLDRNGLPIEMAAEKHFGVKFNEKPREEFLKLCEKLLEQSSAASVESFMRLGISFNSWNVGDNIGDMYLTDSEEYRALTQQTFIELYEQGLIYEAERINNYCPGCQTTLADSEIEYRELPSTFNEIKFKVKETGEEIVIGTTRPELIATCALVIFNPNDKRYKHLTDKTAITPIYNKEVPIKPHPAADPKKGTGLVMICSVGDLSDIRIFREMGLKPTIAIDSSGKMNKQAGFLEGLTVQQARTEIVKRLKEQGLLVGQKKIMHRTPVCERSGHPIEFIAMPEFYLKQVEFKEKMKELAHKLNFYAPKSRQILLDWIESITIDWPISRRRYYATEVPLWYCKKCGKVYVPPKGRYYRPWKEKPPVDKCPSCGHPEFKGEERVFDTWFDSSTSALYILRYFHNREFFERHAPCTLRPQGKEIIRTWLYYTLLKSYLLTGKCIFKDTWINYHILDEKGNKMSKSKGNVIDPREVLDRYGAEPFRLWAAVEGNLTEDDFRCSFERIEGSSKTLTKLWNVARFISSFELKQEKPEELMVIDKWILKELNGLVRYADECYAHYDFHNPAIKIKSFLWDTFASHYLELVKTRAYNNEAIFSEEQQQAAIYTLHYCLQTMLKLLAPIIPFITYKIYKTMYGKDIHFCEFPSYDKALDVELPFTTQELMRLNSEIWQYKKKQGISLNQSIEHYKVPTKFKVIEETLKTAHHIRHLEFE
jgi:valyl-tRNA synthetase